MLGVEGVATAAGPLPSSVVALQFLLYSVNLLSSAAACGCICLGGDAAVGVALGADAEVAAVGVDGERLSPPATTLRAADLRFVPDSAASDNAAIAVRAAARGVRVGAGVPPSMVAPGVDVFDTADATVSFCTAERETGNGWR